MKKAACPFCKGDIDGCCFCEHTGKIELGEGKVFSSEEELAPFRKEPVRESDLRKLFDRGGFNHIHEKI